MSFLVYSADGSEFPQDIPGNAPTLETMEQVIAAGLPDGQTVYVPGRGTAYVIEEQYPVHQEAWQEGDLTYVAGFTGRETAASGALNVSVENGATFANGDYAEIDSRVNAGGRIRLLSGSVSFPVVISGLVSLPLFDTSSFDPYEITNITVRDGSDGVIAIQKHATLSPYLTDNIASSNSGSELSSYDLPVDDTYRWFDLLCLPKGSGVVAASLYLDHRLVAAAQVVSAQATSDIIIGAFSSISGDAVIRYKHVRVHSITPPP